MRIRDVISLIRGNESTTRHGRYQRRYTSPWSTAQLARVVAEAAFGQQAQLLTRADAMSHPAFVKGRGMIVSQIAPAPLVVLDERGPVTTQPAWLYRTAGTLSPYHRMLWTVDDIICEGWSLWGTPRDDAGLITDGERIPSEWWHFDADGRIIVNDEVVSAEEYTLIPGPSEGFLEYAHRSMRGAIALEDAYVKRARVPIPLVELHETVEGSLEDDEIDALIDDYVEARKDENGAVTFTPSGIELKVHGEQAANLAIEGRNFSRIDVANFLMLPASALDGSLSTASLTYSTQEGQRNEVQDYSIAYWSDPIAARFSQDDVVPKGQRVRFDFAQQRTTTPSPTGPVTKD